MKEEEGDRGPEIQAVRDKLFYESYSCLDIAALRSELRQENCS